MIKPQPKEFPPKPMIVRLIEPHGMKFHVKPIVARLVGLQAMVRPMVVVLIRSNYKIPFEVEQMWLILYIA